jgi:hypothetical protein
MPESVGRYASFPVQREHEELERRSPHTQVGKEASSILTPRRLSESDGTRCRDPEPATTLHHFGRLSRKNHREMQNCGRNPPAVDTSHS